MKKINMFGKKLREVTLLIVVLSSMLTTAAFCAVDNSTSKTNHESLISEIDELKENLEATKKEVNEKLIYQMRCNEQAINSVNTSISGASFALKIFAIIVAISAIGLGIYITRQVRNVTNLTRQNRSIYEIHLKIRDEVKQLDENIKNNIGKLYDDLRKEETQALVERLVKVPEDVHNLFDNLASRELPNEAFARLKAAYKNLKGSPDEQHSQLSYRDLLFQHFAGLALFDEDLGPEIEKKLLPAMNSMFRNDIIKSSCDFVGVCVDDGILNQRDKIRRYFVALGGSKHKDYEKVHKDIYETLSTKENRFNLYSILSSDEGLKEIRKVYGAFLLKDYRGAGGNTESEEKVLGQIDEEDKAARAAV